MSEAVSQLAVKARLDGSFEETITTGKRKMGELGAAAREAGKGAGSIGDGMAGSSTKVESATRNMVGSIQRQIAALEAGDKSSRKYQESLARMRGIDTAALKPYLDQLDAVKAKTAAAERANGSLGDSMGGLGSRSLIAANAIAMIGAAIGAAFSAASIKNVIDTADTFAKLSQKSGVAVESLRELNYAASLSDVSTEALGDGLRKLSRNMALAAGGSKLQVAAFDAIGISVKNMDGSLKGADKVLSEVAGKFANFSDGPAKAALAMELFGKQGADLIPLLNSGTSGLSEMATEAAELGVVFGSDLAKNAEAFNDNLTRIQSSSEGAKIAIANELLPTLNLLAQSFLDAQKSGEGFGSFLGGALKTIVESVTILYANVAFVLKGIGREFGAIGAQVVALGKLDLKGFNAISEAVKADGVRARKELDKFQYDLLNAGILTSKAGAGRGNANDPRILGSTQTTAPIVAQTTAIKALSSATKEQAEALKAVAKAYKEAMDAATKVADARKKESDAIDDYMLAESARLMATAKASEDAVVTAQAEYDNQGKLKSVIAETTLVRLQDQLAGKVAGSEAEASLLRQIEAQKQLIGIMRKGEMRDAAEQGAKDMADAQKKAAEESSKYWEDALMRAFESGKGFFESLWDTIKNTLKTQVLKITVQGSMASMGLGASGAASAGGLTSSGLSSIAGIGSIASGAGILGAAGNIVGGAIGAGTVGTGISASIGQGLASLGAMGPVALVGLAAFAAYAIFKKDKTPTQGTGEATLTYGAGGNLIGSDLGRSGNGGLSDLANGVITSMSASYYATAKQLGITAAEATFAFGGNTGKDSKGANFALSSSANGVSYSGSNNNSQSYTPEQLQLEASRAIFTALQSSELPGYLSKVFDGITAGTASQEQIDAAIQFAGSLKTIREALLETREPLQIVKDSVAAAFGDLGTSADRFKTDFVAAIDAGISPDKLAAWQALGANLDVLATATKAAAISVEDYTDALKAVADAQIAVSNSLRAIADYGQTLSDNINTIRGQAVANRDAAVLAFGQALSAAEAYYEGLRAQAEQAVATATGASQNALQAVSANATNAATSLQNALRNVVSAISRAAADITTAQNGVDSARANITTGYLAAQDKLTAAQAALTDAQVRSATALKSAANDLFDTLRGLKNANVALDYTAQKNAFEALAAKALTGDAESIGKLGAAGNSYLSASESGASNAQQYQRDDIRIRQVLGQIGSQFGGIVAADDPTDQLTKNLADATIEMARWTSAVEVSGASRTAVNADILAEYNASLQALANAQDSQAALTAATGTLDLSGIQQATYDWSDAVVEATEAQSASVSAAADLATALSAASAAGISLQAEITPLANFLASLSTLYTATEELAGIGDAMAGTRADIDAATAAFSELGLTVPEVDTALTALATALTNAGTAQTDYIATLASSLVAPDSLIQQYADATAALADFTTRTNAIDFSALAALDPLGDLLQEYADAVSTLMGAQRELSTVESDPVVKSVIAAYESIGRSGFQAGDTTDLSKIDESGFQYWLDQLNSGALALADFQTAFLSSVVNYAGALDYSAAIATASGYLSRGIDLPGYAIGTNYVPSDGPAYLHQGEAVIPAAYNPAAGGQGSSEAVVTEIKALRAELAAMRLDNRAADTKIENNTQRTAKVLERAMTSADSLNVTVMA